jgi:predicted nucleotidyltransferase
MKEPQSRYTEALSTSIITHSENFSLICSRKSRHYKMSGLDQSVEEKIRSVFSGFEEIEKAVLYGSRAKGNYETGSDIDITFYGKNLKLTTIYRDQDKLDELYLPYTSISLFTKKSTIPI